MDTIPKDNIINICQVCGTTPARKNYGVYSCDSCKIFFRRNVDLDLSSQHCSFIGQCDITINTRHTCRYCRLKKCFSVGMQNNLMRCPHTSQSNKIKKKVLIKKNILNKEKYFSPVIIHTLDLLRNDRSLLTTDQWSLLSNITNTYDNRNPTKSIRNIISTPSNYLPKTRMKIADANIMNIVSLMYLAIEPFIKIIPEFRNMENNDRIVLIERNLRNLGGFNCAFIMRESEILNNINYSNSLLTIYGSWTYNSTIKISESLDNDGTLFKLLLVILALSTCCDIVYFEYDQNQSNDTNKGNYILTNTKYLFTIQNIYTEMMFKYMLYRYGYNEAALRFACLIKNFLYQGVLTANAVDNSNHESMVQTVIDKAEESLSLEDQIIDTNT